MSTPLPSPQQSRDFKHSREELLSLLAAVIESTDDVVITKTLDGTITSWNAAAEKVLGYTRDEAVGQSITMLIPPELREEELKIFERLRKGQRIEHYETVRRTKEGRSLDVALTISPLRDEAGVVIGASMILRDISERKRLEHQQVLLSAIVATTDDAIITKTLEGKITSWNAAAERLLGYKAEEIIGQSVAVIIPPDRIHEEGTIVSKLRAGERVDHFETVRRKKDGSEFHVALTISPLFDSNNRIVGASKIMRDISGRIHSDMRIKELMEERTQLLDSERAARSVAEHLNASKDDFLAILSHELRTPLNAIMGWTTILRTVSTDPADLLKGLEVIDRNVRLQTQLVEDLLDVSRIVSGQMRLDVQPVMPSPLVETTVELLRPSAQARRISLEVVLDPSAGPINGDAARLQQVFWNLIGNAIKFTPQGGRIQVVMGRVNSSIEISVSDTGIGISPELLPNVFERFRQSRDATSRRHGGLGLGLAIVRHIVELHGGHVHVTSPGQDQGTTFRVQLPLALVHHGLDETRSHPRPHRAISVPLAAIDLSGTTILVVDDEPDALELLRRVIQDTGARVVAASDAATAVELVGSQRPDLVVTDIGMPEVDGYELLRRIRGVEVAWGGRVPMIALTAFARTEDRTRALLTGFISHLSKPVAATELIATIAAVLQRTG